MDLIFILLVNEEGLTMAECGDAPDEAFAPYSSSIMEDANNMASIGKLGRPVCNAIILEHGRILIMHNTEIDGEQVYLTILCKKLPAGLQKLLNKIIHCLGRSLLGSQYGVQPA